jgi:hypothetical protein
MRWELKGADAASGADRVLNLEARDEAEARALGNYNGLYVESAQPAPTPAMLPYATGARRGGLKMAISRGLNGMRTGAAQARRSSRAASPRLAAPAPAGPACHLCASPLEATVVSAGNVQGIAVALIVFCIGVVIFVLIPVIGWVIGPIICFCALFMGGKRQKVWRCTACRATTPRT